jgi:hypothetical protein
MGALSFRSGSVAETILTEKQLQNVPNFFDFYDNKAYKLSCKIFRFLFEIGVTFPGFPKFPHPP